MSAPLTYLNDLHLDIENPDIMHINVCLQNESNEESVDFAVSLSHMGLSWDDEFEMELSKDLQRDMNAFYMEHQRIPSSIEYKELTERHLYC